MLSICLNPLPLAGFDYSAFSVSTPLSTRVLSALIFSARKWQHFKPVLKWQRTIILYSFLYRFLLILMQEMSIL